jgi:hypothetical protein
MAIDPLTGEEIPQPAAAARFRLPLRFNGRQWRNIALALGLIVATVAGVTGRLIVSDLNPSSLASDTPSPVAAVSVTTSAAPTATPTPTPSPSPTPTPTLPPISASSATITFRDMMVDPSSFARTFTFTTDGQGTVSGQVIAAAPLNSLELCVSANDELPACAKGATPGFQLSTPPGDHAKWVVTLAATQSGTTPIVDLSLTWPEQTASFTLSHGRFQGFPNPDSFRGFILQLKARANGQLHIQASWAGLSAKAQLILTDITAQPAVRLEVKTYAYAPALAPSYAHDVTENHLYQVQMQNLGKDSSRANLVLTVTFP